MDYEIVLAWFVVSIAIIFVGVPMLGDFFTDRFASYKDCFILGLGVAVVIAGILCAAMSVLWAVTVIA